MLLISTYVCAQNSNTTFGIKSGINLSKYSPEIFVGGQRLADYQFNLGFYVGGFSNIEISEKVKIQPEYYCTHKEQKLWLMTLILQMKEEILVIQDLK